MKLTKEEFDKQVVWGGDVIVEIPSLTATKVKFGEGHLELAGSTQNDKKTHATRYGRIVKLPVRSPKIPTDMFCCELDANEGEYCWYDAYIAQRVIESRGSRNSGEDLVYDVGDTTYLRVPGISLLAVKRGESIVGVNGYCIGKVIEESNYKGGIILSCPQTNISRVKLTSVSASKPVFKNPDIFKNHDAKPGDTVLVESFYPQPLDGTYAATSDLVRFQSAMIVAYED